MRYPIGHIFTRGNVKREEIRGDEDNKRWLLEVDGGKWAILIKKYIPNQLSIYRGMTLDDLVLVGYSRKGNPLVAIDKYMDDIIKYYYRNKTSGQIKLENWTGWYQKWGDDFKSSFGKNNYVVDGPIKNISKKHDFYKLIKLKEYVLPIIGYKDLVYLNHPTHFYPGTTYEKSNGDEGIDEQGELSATRAVYKNDNDNQFPKLYHANISGYDENEHATTKDVIVYLHGFTSPAKWHRNVWKHIDSSKGKPSGIFNNCKASPDDKSCNEYYCIENEIFRQVHPNIKQNCNNHIYDIVTIFEKKTTPRILKLYNRNRYNSKFIQICCIENITSDYFSNLIIHGICHNWLDNNPVIHCKPITKYEAYGSATLYDRGRTIFKGMMEDLVEITL